MIELPPPTLTLVDNFAQCVAKDGSQGWRKMQDILTEMRATAAFYAEQDKLHAEAGWIVAGPGMYRHPRCRPPSVEDIELGKALDANPWW